MAKKKPLPKKAVIALPQQFTMSELIDWLEQQQGSALVSDDCGHWAVATDGMQNVPKKTPADIQTTFFIMKNEWKKTIRAAIEAARQLERKQEIAFTVFPDGNIGLQEQDK